MRRKTASGEEPELRWPLYSGHRNLVPPKTLFLKGPFFMQKQQHCAVFIQKTSALRWQYSGNTGAMRWQYSGNTPPSIGNTRCCRHRKCVFLHTPCALAVRPSSPFIILESDITSQERRSVNVAASLLEFYPGRLINDLLLKCELGKQAKSTRNKFMASKICTTTLPSLNQTVSGW